MHRKTIVLFDIDGTLLLTGGAGRRAFEQAFDAIVGQRGALQGIPFAGMTDRAIVRRGLEAAGRAFGEALVEELFDAYAAALEQELQRATSYRIMPGVHDLLRALGERATEVVIGLGTGNLRRGARAKLEHGDLWRFFGFGGFGCDHEDRTELLRVGATRGAAQAGLPLEACAIVVVGDTVRDVQAAKGIGARCLCVETGGVSAAVLRAAGADAVVSDLLRAEALDFVLTGEP